MRIAFINGNVAVLVGSLSAAIAQDVAPTSALSAKAAGAYPLERPWVGEEKTTVLTGFYQKLRHPNTCVVQFDLLTVTDSSWRRVPVGTRVLSQRIRQTTNGWEHTNLHDYRQTLPTDEQIKACSTVSNLVQLICKPDWAEGAPYSARWALFTITPSNTVETLTIHCGAERWTADKIPIEALEVRRGTIHERNPASTKPNNAAAGNAGVEPALAIGKHLPGVPEPTSEVFRATYFLSY